MRKTLLAAVSCVICLSQPGLAMPHELLVIKMSKPDSNPTDFAADRSTCLTKANASYLFPAGTSTWARHHLKLFGECMGAKGYKNDPDGLRTIRYMEDGTHRVFVEAL